MSKTVDITSLEHFLALVKTSTVLVADFYADWCGPCKAVAPVFEGLSKQFSVPNKVTFVRVNVDNYQELTSLFEVTAMPTFCIFKDGERYETIKGANAKRLTDLVTEVARNPDKSGGEQGASGTGKRSSDEAEGPSDSTSNWLGASVPKNYQDITEDIEIKGIDLLNCDNDFGPGKALFNPKAPSGLAAYAEGNGKGKAKEATDTTTTADWVESDTDEQLLVFLPFQSSLKIGSLQITSLPPSDGDEEVPMRPKTVKLYTNRAQIIGFDEADDVEPTQTCTISPGDWDPKTGTAKVDLRYVKFQRVSSLVVYFVDGDGDGEKIRVDRMRLFGDSGEKRQMGKLTKFGEEQGE